jgi:hypothetical protein
MPEDTNKLLEQIVLELRAVKRELAAIHEEVTPFAEERRSLSRMQSPLMGVDHFRMSADERCG